MKVIHTVHEWPPQKISGIGKIVGALWRAAGSAGVEQVVGTLSMTSFRSFSCARSVETPGLIRVEPIEAETMLGQLLVQNESLADRLVESEEPSSGPCLIHCHDWLTLDAAREIARQLDSPLVFTAYSILEDRRRLGFLEMPDDLEDYALRQQELGLLESDAVSVLDDVSASSIARACRVSPVVVPPLVWTGESSESRQEEERYEACYVGRLAPEKGVDLLPEILSRAGVRTFAFAGEGALLHPLKVALAKARIDFEYLGYLESPDSLFAHSACALVPSRYETGPLTVLESILSGTPVIASWACPTAVALYRGCGYPFLADVEPERFAKTVRHAREQATVSRQVTLEARRFLQDRFAVADRFKDWLNVYRSFE